MREASMAWSVDRGAGRAGRRGASSGGDPEASAGFADKSGKEPSHAREAHADGLAVLASIPVSGCATGRPSWVNRPRSVSGKFAAVGIAPCPQPILEVSARAFAEQDGRMKLAQFLQTKVSALVENWSKNVADLLKVDQTFTGLMNSELISRGLTDTNIVGARVVEYYRDDDNVYVLMSLERPEDWVVEAARAYEDRALAEAAFWRAEALKQQFSEKMDALRNESAAREAPAPVSARRLSDGSVGSTIGRVPERRRDPAPSMPTSRFDLQRFAPFRLGRLAARAAAAFAGQGVGEAEWFDVTALSRDGPVTAQAVVRATGAHKTRISRAVADLVERGLVSREDGAADRREYL
ncbi:MAG: MarR family transcriptional regulator, partial [Bauldia sp.]